MGAGVLDRGHRIARHLAFDRQANELRLPRLDVLIHMAQLRRRQGQSSARSKRAQIIDRNHRRRDARLSLGDRRGGVVWNVLDSVKSDVAKVPFVSDSPTTTDNGLALANTAIQNRSTPSI